VLWYAHCNANAVYAYSYTYGYNNADGYSDRNSDSDSYTHADINAQSNAHPEGSAYTAAASHSGTAPIALLMKKKRPAQLRHRVVSTRRISVSAFLNLSVSICLTLVCAVVTSADANIITVTNTNDGGPGSLRQALADANDGDTITFAVTGIIGLASGELVINRNITIGGPGANLLAVSRAANAAPFRIFHVMLDHTFSLCSCCLLSG